MVRKRIQLAQNFFRDRSLDASIVAASTITKEDIVYEVGPGEGIITGELAERVGKVVAVEKDAALAARLRSRFRDKGNVEIHDGDFLRYKIKEKKYKVFSNIPFNITAEVMKEEAAGKFSGSPAETEVSVLAKPWFEFRVLREFRRTDFEPIPSVDVVLLFIARREQPLVSLTNVESYRKFVQFGFEAWKKDLKTVYKHVFTYEQWKRLSKNLSFSLKATPTELRFEQWLGLFEYFIINVIDSKKAKVLLN